LVQEFVKGEADTIRNMGDVLNLLPGPQFVINQPLPPGLKPKGASCGNVQCGHWPN
jgi:hypothetical protein